MSSRSTPWAEDAFECLPVAVRAWPVQNMDRQDIEPGDSPRSGQGRGVARREPHRLLVFDTETTTDQSQRLLYGVWRSYLDKFQPGRRCVEEGIFYADDLPESDPAGFAALRAYAGRCHAATAPGVDRQLKLLSRSEFVEQVLWPWGYKRQATVVGFNLPFDLTRLATYSSRGRGRNRDGVSLRLWEHNGGEHPYRPRIVLRAIDGHRTIITFTQPRDAPSTYRGKFLDVRTLAFAHTDSRSLSLESACARFGVDFQKAPVVHGRISADHVEYCRADVAATTGLFRSLHAEHERHPIELPARNALSAATIGKSYWAAMGVTRQADRPAPLDPRLAGWGMEAFYGGRAECRIRRSTVPVVYVDFLSMYMTCNALMGTWRLITAEQINPQVCTSQVRRLIDEGDLAHRCFDPSLWSQLHTLVKVRPNGATLPVRARYDRASESWGIGVNPYQSERAGWYPLADVLAAHLLGDFLPVIEEAIRLVPDRPLRSLKPLDLCGEIPINPRREDFFRACVEHRRRCQQDAGRTPEERQRLDRFLKVLANSTGFGILAQFNRTRTTDPVAIDVYAGEGTPFATTTTSPETAGDYCYPPLAATVTGAARLMLALLEHHVTAAGGTFAFCDTDSMAIVATSAGGTISSSHGHHPHGAADATHALSWTEVDDIVNRFSALNPYDTNVVPGSILKIESENFHPVTGEQRQLHCFAISAKRYQLTSGAESVKCSEHGLGHVMNPRPGTRTGGWVEEAWRWLRQPETAEPDWLDLPALSPITVGSPDVAEWFRAANHGKPYADRIRPGNFLVVAHPDPLDPAAIAGSQPIAPFTRDPREWKTLSWIDRRTGQPITPRTGVPDGVDRPGTIRIQTYRDLLSRYLAHPEAKALAADGTPVRADTTGLLQRRPIRAVLPIVYLGKEANDLDHRAAGIADRGTNHYVPDDNEWQQLVVPTLRTLPTAEIARSTGVHVRTVQRTLSGQCMPRRSARLALAQFGAAYARLQLGLRPSHDGRAAMYELVRNSNQNSAAGPVGGKSPGQRTENVSQSDPRSAD